jgi:multidrug efflux system membrane fusion protein
MNDMSNQPEAEAATPMSPGRPRRTWRWLAAVVALGLAGGAWFVLERRAAEQSQAAAATAAAAPLAPVTVTKPLQRDVDTRIGFLGQFSAVNRIELRAQVGGTLTEIHFIDGQTVRAGDLLFVIDPRPYEIKLAQVRAQFETAKARLELAKLQIVRAQALRKTEFGSQENLDQRTNEQSAAQAAVDQAQAQIHDAELDLGYCRVTAPFDGRIGARQVSIGALVAGSRAATSPTTLLTTLVSLDPIYLDFDMSESDFLSFSRGRANAAGPLANKVTIALSDEHAFTRDGVLDFVDNALDRASGTLHARATVANPDLFLAPGQFARVRAAVAPPAPALLLPDAAVALDQSKHVVMTVAADGTVTPKQVDVGDFRGGLRVIRSGLAPDDRVIIDGLVRAIPGMKVAPQDGAIAYDAAADGQG